MAFEEAKVEVNDSIDDEIDDIYNELYESLVKTMKYLNHANKRIKSLVCQVKEIEKENNDLNILHKKLFVASKTCSQCETYKAKINELNKALEGSTSSMKRLNSILGNQKRSHNQRKKKGLALDNN